MSAGRFWRGWLVATAVVFGAFWVLLHTLGVDPRPWRLLLLVALVMAVLALVNLNASSEASSWEVYSSQPSVESGQDARLSMYVRTIGGHLDSRAPDPGLRDRFAALADGRLHQRHGIGLHDPAAADLLGRDVADILTGPPRRLRRDEIETCVRSIELL